MRLGYRPRLTAPEAAGDLNCDGGSKAVFDTYRKKYENVRMKREDGILEVTLIFG